VKKDISRGTAVTEKTTKASSIVRSQNGINIPKKKPEKSKEQTKSAKG